MKEIRIVAVVVACLVALWCGQQVIAAFTDRAELRAQVDAQRAQIDTLTATHDEAMGNARAAAQAESARIERDAKRDAHYNHLQRDTDRYAQDLGRVSRGNADPEFVRIWQQANAGAAD
ncbi:TPA: hypothetical protein ACOECQ_000810 [Stenotrophomonas maltophilia]